MMQFLRKHQKKLFFVIAVMTIASFTVFGTFSTFDSAQPAPSKKIGVALDNAPIYDKDLKIIAHFLTTNDRFTCHLFETGVLSLLAEKYFEKIQTDLEEKLAKARTATFYSHPRLPFLTAAAIWSYARPELVQALQEVQSSPACPKAFHAYAKLYTEERAFPPEALQKQLIQFQQNFPASLRDPHLERSAPRHFALFGQETFEEWFGPTFTHLLGKFLFNTAAIAEKKGYKVSQNEARTELRKYIGSMKDPHLLQRMGTDESTAISLWKKILLVSRYFQDFEQGILLDSLGYTSFSSFAGSKASIECYELPDPLRVKNFEAMLKVQYYLEAISPHQTLDIPRKFYTPEQVEKKHPEFVISRYELEIAKATLEEISTKVNLKEIWDFEITDSGWNLLTEQFPLLKKAGSETREAILDGIDSATRSKIDKVALQNMTKNHPEKSQAVLAAKTPTANTISIRSKGVTAPFDDLEDPGLLLSLLKSTEIGSVLDFVSPSLTYYQIKVLAKPTGKEIMTLAEALKHPSLKNKLDEKLETAWIDLRKKDPSLYKDKDGSWKPFEEVKDMVGAHVYADLLALISPTPLPFPEYAARRFEKVMRDAHLALQKGEETPLLEETASPLLGQWKLMREQREIKRCDETFFSKEEIFSNPIGSWSSLHVSTVPAFFKLLERYDPETNEVDSHVHEGQKLLGYDAVKKIVEHLLDEVGSL